LRILIIFRATSSSIIPAKIPDIIHGTECRQSKDTIPCTMSRHYSLHRVQALSQVLSPDFIPCSRHCS
jgi:hypothetical protein